MLYVGDAFNNFQNTKKIPVAFWNPGGFFYIRLERNMPISLQLQK